MREREVVRARPVRKGQNAEGRVNPFPLFGLHKEFCKCVLFIGDGESFESS